MSKKYLRLVLAVAAVLITVSSVSAITKVPRAFGVLEFSGGYSIPTGSYSHLGVTDFIVNGSPVDIDASNLYNSSYFLNVSYGSLRGNHWLVSAGFMWSHIRPKDTITYTDATGQYGFVAPSPKPSFNQYDIRINANYLFADLESAPWSPFVGLGFAAGISSQTLPGYHSENETNVAFGVNFGAELKIWQAADKRNFVTLASTNNWDFLASGYRPKNFNIGAAIKVYMRN